MLKDSKSTRCIYNEIHESSDIQTSLLICKKELLDLLLRFVEN